MYAKQTYLRSILDLQSTPHCDFKLKEISELNKKSAILICSEARGLCGRGWIRNTDGHRGAAQAVAQFDGVLETGSARVRHVRVRVGQQVPAAEVSASRQKTGCVSIQRQVLEKFATLHVEDVLVTDRVRRSWNVAEVPAGRDSVVTSQVRREHRAAFSLSV